jgi:hypothetical protein
MVQRGENTRAATPGFVVSRRILKMPLLRHVIHFDVLVELFPYAVRYGGGGAQGLHLKTTDETTTTQYR